MNFSASTETNAIQPRAPRLKVPRIESLDHRLRRAKDADGKPIPIRDELLVFLEDPPRDTGDRWEKGAELCRSRGIETSRMSVWRFYRANIVAWRREQTPLPPKLGVDAGEIVQLQEEARHLAALRALDFLNDPNLTPGQLIAFLQHDNQGEKLQLARDQFSDRVEVRRGQELREQRDRVYEEARQNADRRSRLEFFQRMISHPKSVTPHTTPSRNIPGTPSGSPQKPASGGTNAFMRSAGDNPAATP